VSVMRCQVQVSASGRSLAQRSPTESDVSECDREASIRRRPWPIGGCCAREEEDILLCRALSIINTTLRPTKRTVLFPDVLY
jgi:hypothetical protein